MVLRLFNRPNLGQQGDTIVEVMISLVIISTILVAGFQASNTSASNVRDTQEHSQAFELARGQVELLRVKEGLDTDTYGCYSTGGTPAAAGSVACDFAQSGTANCTPAAEAFCYQVKITTEDTSSGSSQNASIATTYRVKITWDNIKGGRDSSSLVYRISAPNPSYQPPSTAPAPIPDPNDPFGVNLVNQGGVACGGAGQPACAASQVGYTKNMNYKILNVTNIANVERCVWDWGNGDTTTVLPGAPNGMCDLSGSASHYYFKNQPGDLPPGTSPCTAALIAPYQKSYTITFTAYRQAAAGGGSETSKNGPFTIPDCF